MLQNIGVKWLERDGEENKGKPVIKIKINVN